MNRHNRARHAAGWLFCSLLLLSGAGRAQSARTGTVSGFVYDRANGEALIGANVALAGTGRGAATNASGYFVIPRVSPGAYELVVHYIGYETFRQQVLISSDEARKVRINLQPRAITIEEIVVVADSTRVGEMLYRKPISRVALDQRQINQIPQIAEADLLRSLQTLPGVLPISDFSSELYIRGGTPDQNLYLLDGTDVYNPEHAFGLFSTFNTDAIKHVELSKGGFGAAYGGRLSSILDVTNLDGNREKFEGESQISLLSAKTTLQLPIGGIGSLSASIRRTYFDQTLARAIDDLPNYYFYDGNVKAFFELDPANKLTVSVYGGRDFLDLIFNQNAEDQSGLKYDWGNKTGSLRWSHIFTPELFGDFWLTGSRFSSDFKFGDDLPVTERNFISDVTLKGNLEYYFSDWLSHKFGFEYKNLHAIFRQQFPGGRVDVDSKPRHFVAYYAADLQPDVRWDIEAGVRYNYFMAGKTFTNIAPRLSLKYRLTDTATLKGAAGLFYQYLHRIPRAFIADIWTSANTAQDQSSARHFILGFQQEVARYIQVEVEAYYKSYTNLYEFDQNFLTRIRADRFENGDPVYASTRGLFNEGDGSSTGIEVLLRKDTGIVTGWIGYAFARTAYRFAAINSGKVYPPRHDRTSALNFTGTLDLRNALRALHGRPRTAHRTRWTLGFNFVYTSGQPLTAPGSVYFVNTAPNFDFIDFKIYPGEINNFRLPPYARLDLSLSFEKRYRSWTLAPYLQIYNIGNRKNVWFLNYDFSVQENRVVQEVGQEYMFPLLPTIGVNFKF